MIDIEKIADEADMIVNGYAFTKCDLGFRVLNLNRFESSSTVFRWRSIRNNYG